MYSIALMSCGGDDNDSANNTNDSNFGETTSEVANRDLLASWHYSGSSQSIPSFDLMSDGKCHVSTNANGTGTNCTWAYDTETKVLAISGYPSYALTIKLLTSNMLSAEWSSIKYGTRIDTWTSHTPFGLDPAWEKLIIGKWIGEYGTITFHDGKFIFEIQGEKEKIPISGSYTLGTMKDGNNEIQVINLTSDIQVSYEYASSYKSYENENFVMFRISGLNGHSLKLYSITDNINRYIVTIEGVSVYNLKRIYTYEKYY